MSLSGFTRHDTFLQHRFSILLLSISLLFLTASLGLFAYEQRKPLPKTQAIVLTPKPVRVMVNISGAVKRPGIYELLETKRLKDVILMAGGLTKDADRSYYAIHFNEAEEIHDAEKIYIPTSEDIKNGLFASPAPEQESIGSVGISINTASSSELEALPGIGKVTAQKIIDGRPYDAIEDLVSKTVISEAIFNKISSLINAD